MINVFSSELYIIDSVNAGFVGKVMHSWVRLGFSLMFFKSKTNLRLILSSLNFCVFCATFEQTFQLSQGMSLTETCIFSTQMISLIYKPEIFKRLVITICVYD